MIRLRTLGECVIEVDGEHHTPDSDQLFAALVYLTTERGRRLPRQALAELLWPHHEAARGRHCLRQLLYRLRIGGAPVEGGRETLVLPEPLVAPTFSAAPAAERLVAERMAGTFTIGPFLPGYEPRFSDRFAEWLDKARAGMEARVRRVLLEVAHAHRLRGEWGEVDALARDVLLLDPLNEEATLAHAEATAMAGAKNEAIEILDRFVAELGPERSQLHLPATVLRRRIAERFPSRRYGGPSERCFVGRAAIMQTLSTALLRARNGEGSGVLLTGAPGIGKTRLVHELTKVASMQGVRVVRATTVESDVDRPLSAFSEAVPQLRALPGAIGVAPDSLAFLDRLTEVHPAGDVQPDDISDPRWIASRIRQSIVDLCDAVTGEATVLLVIEDVHWLDASSWAVIAALLEWLPKKRLLMVLTSRGPHPTPVTPQRCVEQLAVHPVLALTPEAAAAYARAIVEDHGGSLGEEPLVWCVSVGEGNPLFLRELVVHCLEGGAAGTMPPSLQWLLDARLARLSPTARRVLETAVLLDQFAATQRIQCVLELPTHEIAGALVELAENDVLDGPDVVIRPRHALLAARVTTHLPPAVRRLLHRRIASALSTDPGAGTTEQLLASAAHWEAAGTPDHATRALQEAATAVQRLGDVRHAIRLLDAALDTVASPAARRSVLRILVPLLTLDGDYKRAASTGVELLRNQQLSNTDESHVHDQLLAIGAQFRAGGDPEPLLRSTQQIAEDEAIPLVARLAAARQLVILASLSGLPFDHGLVGSISAVEVEQPGAALHDLLNLRMIFHSNFGDLHEAVRAARELHRLAIGEVDLLRRLAALTNVGHALSNVGFNEQAHAVFQVARTESRRLGSQYFEAQAILALLGIAAENNDSSSARRWLDDLRMLGDLADYPWLNDLLLYAEVRVAIMERHYAAAQRIAQECLQRARAATHPPVWQMREALTVSLEALMAGSTTAPPAELVYETLRYHEAMQDRLLQDRTAAVLIVALRRVGRANEAAELERKYVGQHRRSLVAWTSAADVLGPAIACDWDAASDNG